MKGRERVRKAREREGRGKRREKEREGEEAAVFPSAGLLALMGCVRQKLGTRNSSLLSYTGGKDPSNWVIIHCFCRQISRELDLKHNSQNSEAAA